MKSLSRVQLFATPWTIAHQAPPSMEFSREEYCSGVAMSFSRGSCRLRDQTRGSHHCRQTLYHLSHQGNLIWDKVCLIHYWVPILSLLEVSSDGHSGFNSFLLDKTEFTRQGLGLQAMENCPEWFMQERDLLEGYNLQNQLHNKDRKEVRSGRKDTTKIMAD